MADPLDFFGYPNKLAPIFARLVVQRDGCITWTGSVDSGGYAMAWFNGRHVRVHRLMYEVFIGAIPAGKVMHHRCRQKLCANPTHLEPCSTAENVLKDHPSHWMKTKREQTHCLHGHPLFGENLYLRPEGGRACRACRRVIIGNYKHRLRQRKLGHG